MYLIIAHLQETVRLKALLLSRPWRIHAKVVLLNCEYSDQIIDEGFTDWNKPESHETVYYAEYNGHGDGYKPEKEQPMFIS